MLNQDTLTDAWNVMPDKPADTELRIENTEIRLVCANPCEDWNSWLPAAFEAFFRLTGEYPTHIHVPQDVHPQPSTYVHCDNRRMMSTLINNEPDLFLYNPNCKAATEALPVGRKVVPETPTQRVMYVLHSRGREATPDEVTSWMHSYNSDRRDLNAGQLTYDVIATRVENLETNTINHLNKVFGAPLEKEK